MSGAATPPAWLEARDEVSTRCVAHVTVPVSVVAIPLTLALLCGVMAGPALAVVAPSRSPVATKEFRNPNLHIVNLEREVGQLGAPAQPQLLQGSSRPWGRRAAFTTGAARGGARWS